MGGSDDSLLTPFIMHKTRRFTHEAHSSLSAYSCANVAVICVQLKSSNSSVEMSLRTWVTLTNKIVGYLAIDKSISSRMVYRITCVRMRGWEKKVYLLEIWTPIELPIPRSGWFFFCVKRGKNIIHVRRQPKNLQWLNSEAGNLRKLSTLKFAETRRYFQSITELNLQTPSFHSQK